ncbi:MAG: hypothetical protein ABIB79_01585 [archaeon]
MKQMYKSLKKKVFRVKPIDDYLTGLARSAYINRSIDTTREIARRVLAMQKMYTPNMDRTEIDDLRSGFYGLALRMVPKINHIRGKRKARIALNSGSIY